MSKEKRPGRLPSSEAQSVKRFAFPFRDKAIDAEWSPGAQEIASIAGLISEPGSRVLGLTSANKATGFRDFSDLGSVFEDSATFCVVPAKWLLAVDADNAEQVDRAERWASWVRSRPGAWALEVASGGGADRKHVWAYLPALADRAEAARRARKARIGLRGGEGGRMRPIYAPHKTGNGWAAPIGYTFAEVRGLLEAAREREGTQNAPAAHLSAAQLEGRTNPRAATEDAPAPNTERPKGNLTGYKTRAGCDGSGSEALHRIMVEALQDGEDPDEVFARVMAEPSAARDHLTKDRADPRAKWERKWEQELLDWQNGKRPPVVGSRDDAKALLRCAAQDVEDHPERWTGKAGATDREVLLALYRLAHDLGSVSGFEVSVRQVAELAKVSSKTAGKALLRLRNADNAGRFPYLKKIASHREGATVRTIGRYRLNFRREVRWMLRKVHTNTHTPDNPLGTVFDSQHPSGDAFRWGCLGPNAKRVLLFLQSVPNASGRAVAEATGLSPSTVSRNLKKLATMGEKRRDVTAFKLRAAVVCKVRGNWVALRDVKQRLERFAFVYRTAGTVSRHRAQHAKDREQWARHCAEVEAKQKLANANAQKHPDDWEPVFEEVGYVAA